MRFPEYLDTFPAVAVNTGMLVGHNTLRLMVMGLEDRAPRPAVETQGGGAHAEAARGAHVHGEAPPARTAA